MAAVAAVLKSEWTKIRTVSSTIWTLASALIATVAIGAALCALMRSQFDDLKPAERLTFDPTLISFSGMILGQLAMVVFGVLVVGTEYSSGMIRSSLAAVPRRATFLFSKVTVATALALVVGLVTSFLTFFLGQALLGPHRTTIGEPHVLRAVIGAGLYMALIALFSMGVAAMLRSSMLSLGILMPFFFLDLADPVRRAGRQGRRPLLPGPGRLEDHAGGAGRDEQRSGAVRALGRPRHHGAVGDRGAGRRLSRPQAAGRLRRRMVGGRRSRLSRNRQGLDKLLTHTGACRPCAGHRPDDPNRRWGWRMIEAVGLTKRYGAKTAVYNLSFRCAPARSPDSWGPTAPASPRPCA